jgi:transposase InsO family protein
MPWSPKDVMSLRQEFVLLARQPDANIRALCRRFEISPATAYKLLKRYAQQGHAGLADQSRRPQNSPGRTPAPIEQAIVDLRQTHPAWGGRKIAARLRELGHAEVPPPSTVTSILHRHGLINPAASAAATPWQRFEHALPNALWQIDFKGYFETPAGRCHPLTLIDDHSRFNLLLAACGRTDTAAVQQALTGSFRRYGLPVRINADNGAPWGSSRAPGHGLTDLTIWLLRLGISVSHSRPYHPQTNGKLERFHRSLKAEVLNGRSFKDLQQAQLAFDHWRVVYNQQRPHEGIGMAVPVSHYRPSEREFPDTLAPIEYGPDDHVLTVKWDGKVVFKGHRLKVSNALHQLPIAFRPDPEQDGCYDVYFCHQRFMQLNLRLL